MKYGAMLHGLAFLTILAAGNAQALAKAPPTPPTPCAYPMFRLASDQPEARKHPPTTRRGRDERHPPCAILQKWSPADAGAPSAQLTELA